MKGGVYRILTNIHPEGNLQRATDSRGQGGTTQGATRLP